MTSAVSLQPSHAPENSRYGSCSIPPPMFVSRQTRCGRERHAKSPFFVSTSWTSPKSFIVRQFVGHAVVQPVQSSVETWTRNLYFATSPVHFMLVV